MPTGLTCYRHPNRETGVSCAHCGRGGGGALLTKVLIGINVLVFLWQVGSGGTLSQPYGYPYLHGALNGILVANGDWWRLFTSMFLHASVIHLALNMLFLWWIAAPVEQALGRALFALNLAFTFAIPGISIGGHLGGLVGGALSALALSRLGRAHAAYGNPGLTGVAGVLAVGVASVAISLWAVAGYL